MSNKIMYGIYLNVSNGDYSRLTSFENVADAYNYCKEYVKGLQPFIWDENDKCIRFSLEIVDEANTNGNDFVSVYETNYYVYE